MFKMVRVSVVNREKMERGEEKRRKKEKGTKPCRSSVLSIPKNTPLGCRHIFHLLNKDR